MKKVIISQLLSSIAMLQNAVNNCPDELWDNEEHENKYWHIVYHALYFTDLYLSPSMDRFKSWDKARNEYQFLGPVPWPPHYTPKIEQSYSRAELNEYIEKIKAESVSRIDQDDLNANSGFDWLPFNRMELHLYSIRHLQHHTGQLVERLKDNGVSGTRWVVAVNRDAV
ncbi:DinB family protein [Paenibacillus alkalitolerans]|uniref:DinB family protein n=1 Tax=Paenibacillus alkalitolerans TaxID=2799335 RepID=UPI0018F75DC0|nr:DinB family protein [Paenibacillus alkalitolerans]